MTKIRASVAMAVYQGEKYLIPQIQSILAQLGLKDEFIISYDFSTDATRAIIDSYVQQDHRIQVVKDTGSGVIDNFNHAFSHCRGQYIFISDQDDIWLPGKIEGMISALKSTKAALVIHNGIPIDEKGKVIGKDFFSAYRIGAGFWKNFLKSRYSGCCMAFTADFAKKALPVPKGIDAYDRYLALLAEAYATITFCDEIWIQHRFHGDNYTPEQSRSLGVIFKTRLAMGKTLGKKREAFKRGQKK